jgi:hypothetical protein
VYITGGEAKKPVLTTPPWISMQPLPCVYMQPLPCVYITGGEAKKPVLTTQPWISMQPLPCVYITGGEAKKPVLGNEGPRMTRQGLRVPNIQENNSKFDNHIHTAALRYHACHVHACWLDTSFLL